MNGQLHGGILTTLSTFSHSEGAVFWLLTALLMGFALILLLLLKSGRKRVMAEDMLKDMDNKLKLPER